MGSSLSTSIITEATIRADAERFSQLHSWWKHIKEPGEAFVLFFAKGEQERHPVSPEVKDSEGLHLHIWYLKCIKDLTVSLPLVCLINCVVLTKQLEGHSAMPESPAEIARQKMIEDIVQHALVIARETGVFAVQQ